MDVVEDVIRVVSEKYFVVGFISGFLYGAWVSWSLSGKTAKI